MATNPANILGGGIQPAQRSLKGSIGGPTIGNMGLAGQLGNYSNILNKGLYGQQQQASYMGGYSPGMLGTFQPQSAGKNWGFTGNLPNYSPSLGLLGFTGNMQANNSPSGVAMQATAPGFSRAFVPQRNEAEQAAVFTPNTVKAMNKFTAPTPYAGAGASAGASSGGLGGPMPSPGAIGNFGQLGTAISGSGTGTPNFGSYIPTFQGPPGGYNNDPFLQRGALASNVSDISRTGAFRNRTQR
jgi:hypothetical protein